MDEGEVSDFGGGLRPLALRKGDDGRPRRRRLQPPAVQD